MNLFACCSASVFAWVFLVDVATAESVSEAWVKRCPGRKVVVDSNGDVIVTGTSAESDRIFTIKFSSDGKRLWERHVNNTRAELVAVDNADDILIHGATYNANGTSLSGYTAKYRGRTGKIIWEKRYARPVQSDYYYSPVGMVLDSQGNVIITGSVFAKHGRFSFGYTAKYSADSGALRWERVGRPFSNNSAVATDETGDVYVAGNAEYVSEDAEAAQSTDFYTAKLSSGKGKIVWERHSDGSKNLGDYASCIAVDRAGNVAVSGSSEYRAVEVPDGEGNTYTEYLSDIYTIKYRAANGALLWQNHSRRPDADSAEAVAVAIDKSGDVIVSGYYEEYFYEAAHAAAFTAKYATTSGVMMWEQSHPVGNFSDSARPTGMAVDDAGNVVVTDGIVTDYGFSSKGGYTAKYAANGALLWSFFAREDHGDYSDRRSVALGLGFTIVSGDGETRKLVDGPTPLTMGVQDLSATNAMLQGTVNPNGFKTSFTFEFGTDPTLAGATLLSGAQLGAGTERVRVHAPVVSLAPLTIYYYRVIANGNGQTVRGAIQQFTTQNRMD